MPKLSKVLPVGAGFVLLLVALLWMRPPTGQQVVVYTSVDEDYAKTVAERFEKESGIKVLLRADSEAVKTTAMLERLRALKDHPDGDVVWNSELSGTLALAKFGVLEPFKPTSARDIPKIFKDPNGLWTGFGLRARVLIYNTARVKPEQAPKYFEDLLKPEWRGRFCLARPLFGTTRSHLASLVLALGRDKGFAFLKTLRENGSAGGSKKWIVDGNAAVRDRVAEGVFDLGLADTDDFYEARDRHQPVGMVWLEQTAEWPGVFLIPNSAGLLHGAPHPEAAKKFLEFLLRPEIEALLAEQGARQIPVRDAVPVPKGYPRRVELRQAETRDAALTDTIDELGEKIDRLLNESE